VAIVDKMGYFKRPVMPTIKEWLEMWEAQLGIRPEDVEGEKSEAFYHTS
jgi:hypothetical protein